MTHPADSVGSDMHIVYAALSKNSFYAWQHITRHALLLGYVPIIPFRVFDYYVGDSVDRDLVRKGNNSLVESLAELWVYGEVSDGVHSEIQRAGRAGKKIRYWDITDVRDIRELDIDESPVLEHGFEEPKGPQIDHP